MLTKVATLEEAKELLEKLHSAYYNVAVQGSAQYLYSNNCKWVLF